MGGLRLTAGLLFVLAMQAVCQETAAAHSRRGIALQQQGRTAEAIAELRRAAELAPPAAGEYSYNLALALLSGGQAGEALAVLDAHPGAGGDTFALRGAVLNALDRAPDAVEALRRAVALDANNADSLYDLAITLLKLDSAKDAAALLERGRVRFPRVAKIHAAAGMVAYLNGRNAEAVKAYEAAVRLEPGAADLYAALGDVYDATGDLARAETSYARSLRLDASVAAVHVKAGRNFSKLQRPREAETAFTRALARDAANAEAHFQLGKLVAARGDHAGAIAHYTQAVAATPALKEAWYQLGISYRRAGDEEKSLAALEHFRKLQ